MANSPREKGVQIHRPADMRLQRFYRNSRLADQRDYYNGSSAPHRPLRKPRRMTMFAALPRLSLIVVALLLAWASTNSAESRAADSARRPNIIVFLIDDLGFTDLSGSGSKLYETPHLDRLAEQGVKFTHAYSACTVCSPTRAALLTGKYPARLHITDWIAGQQRPFAKLQIPDWTKFLPLEETTLAELLKPAGYATASVGKWHLGGEGYEPTRQGFDVNIGGDARGAPKNYFAPYNIPSLAEGPQGESLTERLTIEAEKFIEAHREQPFFIYFPHYTVHTPLQAKPEVVAKYQAKIERLGLAVPTADAPRDLQTQHPQRNATYAAMIESMDDSVGRITAALDRLKLSEDTIVMFTGDNGGLMSSTDNAPARVGKGSAYEGGVRVPLIVRYPKGAAAGATCDDPVVTVDFVPTLLELAGLPAAPVPIDGVSFIPLLKQTGKLARTDIFWHYPHYHAGGATPYGAIRSGDWRLVEFYEDDRVELYNLRDDEGERRDLAQSDPERAKSLREKLHAWRKEVGAQMPSPNPNYDAAKDAAQGRGKQQPKGGKKKPAGTKN
ncbi:MAG: sulfatase [Pirellulales bacterium]